MLWNNIKAWGNEPGFYKFSGKIWPFFAVLAFLSLSYGTYAGLCLAPADYQQGDAFRIMYVHVPSAILSLSIYTIIGINSIIYLIWRIKIADLIAANSASIGTSFTFLALITGAIWGKPMWGTWWVWDARLTSELLLLFLYLGYLGLRQALMNPQLAAKASALLAIVGLLDVPIVHYSVVWWHTLHQGATLTQFKKPTIALSMLYPLLSMLLGFFCFYITIVLLKCRLYLQKHSPTKRWMQRA